ncbi:MAG TPA: YheV family putative metal-binding protein [Moraxellaceae bacterium]|nr:YheV family putative metal-binding protein [Moraxellaceae bacterium]
MIRKHFIAGARCPQCQAIDKVRFCRDGEHEWIECVACGLVSENPGEPEHPPASDTPEANEGVVRFTPRR